MHEALSKSQRLISVLGAQVLGRVHDKSRGGRDFCGRTFCMGLPPRAERFAPPALVFAALLSAWESYVRFGDVPPYVLPSPTLIFSTLISDWATLFPALLVTLRTTLGALAAAVIGGVGLALLFTQWRWVERSFLPFAIVLQVTPVVAIAPLLLIYLDAPAAVLVCAFLVAFFPILSNTALGLASADRNLVDLFKLYRATRWQTLLQLRLPSALPYFLGGLRIGGGLALIGAIVAELAAGNAGKGAGLAFRIAEAGYRLNIPRMFAALTLIGLTGIAIYAAFAALSSYLLGRWHESAAGPGN
jgi:NitT/TauT family transport system permease protein